MVEQRPLVLMTCCFCMHKGAFPDEVAQFGTRFECIDQTLCADRAASSGIYAHTESELTITQHEAMQGAPR